MGKEGGSSDIGLPIGNRTDDNRRQADAATEVAGAIFGQAPSKGLTFARATAIESEANFARRLVGAENFINISANETTALQRARQQREDEDQEAIAETLATIQRRHEREEWARAVHSFGSTRMSGAEWQAFAQELRGDTALRRWLEERIRRDGHSADAARGIADRVADVADIMAIPESQRTAEQRQRLEAARRDPTLSRYLDDAANRFQATRPRTAHDRTLATGSTAASARAGADELAGFTTAPDVRGQFVAAQARQASSEPALPATPVGTSVPAPTPQASGFDI